MDSTEKKIENFNRLSNHNIQRITFNRIDQAELLKSFNVDDGKSGAIVSFTGSVRNHSVNGIVKGMYYESYQGMAEEKIKNIENIVREKWNINKIKVIHRIGELTIGDISIIILVSAYHSKDAFEACQFILHKIKNEVPIWKRELLNDGSKRWIEGNSICSH